MQLATLPDAPEAPTVEPERVRALDDPSEWENFSRPVPGREGSWESYLAISGMYCPACSLNVEQALGQCAGVESVQVNGATQTARVVWTSEQARPSQWLGALQRAGYGGLPAGDMLAAVPRL